MANKSMLVKPVAAAVGVAFVTSLAFSQTALADTNPVFVNIVVAFIDHAAFRFCPFSALFSCGGLSQTSVTGFQFLVMPVQRSG
jgi:hypothetical protein